MEYDQIKQEFNELVLSENWNELNKLRLQIEETGNKELEIELMDTLTDEQIQNYKEWDRETNGDIGTQMDDNS